MKISHLDIDETSSVDSPEYKKLLFSLGLHEFNSWVGVKISKTLKLKICSKIRNDLSAKICFKISIILLFLDFM